MTGGRTDRRTDGTAHRRTGRRAAGRSVGRSDPRPAGWNDGPAGESADRRAERRIAGHAGGRAGGRHVEVTGVASPHTIKVTIVSSSYYYFFQILFVFHFLYRLRHCISGTSCKYIHGWWYHRGDLNGLPMSIDAVISLSLSFFHSRYDKYFADWYFSASALILAVECWMLRPNLRCVKERVNEWRCELDGSICGGWCVDYKRIIADDVVAMTYQVIKRWKHADGNVSLHLITSRRCNYSNGPNRWTISISPLSLCPSFIRLFRLYCCCCCGCLALVINN